MKDASGLKKYFLLTGGGRGRVEGGYKQEHGKN